MGFSLAACVFFSICSLYFQVLFRGSATKIKEEQGLSRCSRLGKRKAAERGEREGEMMV